MNPTLYILMRRDMDSMNPGKAMAQAAHAANQFIHKCSDRDLESALDMWTGEAYVDGGPEGRQISGFGTTIVLGVWSQRELEDIVRSAQSDHFEAGTVLDNTYPLKDGKAHHYFPVVTCGYVFTPCRHKHPVPELSSLELHP
jgi:Peptidyl-tRNA hydrolase PTH2